MAVSLIPAFGTLYQRLTLPESTRYIKSQQSPTAAAPSNEEESFDEKHPSGELAKKSPRSSGELAKKVEEPAPAGVAGVAAGHRSHFQDFCRYFSEWRHAKILIGTCSCWFLLDIAYVFCFFLTRTPPPPRHSLNNPKRANAALLVLL